MSTEQETVVEVATSIASVDPLTWDRIANPAGSAHDPFVSHAFLKALEASGAIGRRSGWAPQHLLLREGSVITGAMPLYVKSRVLIGLTGKTATDFLSPTAVFPEPEK